MKIIRVILAPCPNGNKYWPLLHKGEKDDKISEQNWLHKDQNGPF